MHYTRKRLASHILWSNSLNDFPHSELSPNQKMGCKYSQKHVIKTK